MIQLNPETMSSKDLEQSGWKIVPYNLECLVRVAEAPTPAKDLRNLKPEDERMILGKVQLESRWEVEEDLEDMLDGLEARSRYQMKGVSGLKSYREYREQRIKEKP